jgi:hypothetical protein
VRYHEEVVRPGEEAVRIKNGFDLELYGTHDHGHSSLTPGCERCVATYGDLRQIAEWILPKEERPSVSEIESFDHSLHGERSAKPRFEVELKIAIRHRHGWDRPVDECEKRCLGEMEAKLREIGVRRR